jgi:ribosomal protein S18 acetylase RimI-like enzyme
LTLAAYRPWIPVLGREPGPMLFDFAAAVRDHLVYLLEDGGALAGLIDLIPLADHLVVESVAVAPAAQGQGVGRRLLAHAEAVARERGLAELRLLTNVKMETNIILYQRLGYREASRGVSKTGYNVVFMSKSLT